MMVCDKCKSRVKEERDPFEIKLYVKSGSIMRHIAGHDACLCELCVAEISKAVAETFAAFFGGRDNVDLTLEFNDDGMTENWGGKFAKMKPILDKIAGPIPNVKS